MADEVFVLMDAAGFDAAIQAVQHLGRQRARLDALQACFDALHTGVEQLLLLRRRLAEHAGGADVGMIGVEIDTDISAHEIAALQFTRAGGKDSFRAPPRTQVLPTDYAATGANLF